MPQAFIKPWERQLHNQTLQTLDNSFHQSLAAANAALNRSRTRIQAWKRRPELFGDWLHSIQFGDRRYVPPPLSAPRYAPSTRY